jgi:ElaB/YqjD/DUF883 family membrane-anchored ribosome-binding protein
MGQNTEELRAEEIREDIAQTRADLGRDLDALGDRVSPRRMMERRTNRTRRWFGSARDRIMGSMSEAQHAAGDRTSAAAERMSSGASAVPEMATEGVRGHPTVAGAVAFGVGFLVALAITPSEREVEVVERMEPHLEPMKGELASSAQNVTESVKETGKEVAGDLQSSAKEHAENVKESAGQSSR